METLKEILLNLNIWSVLGVLTVVLILYTLFRKKRDGQVSVMALVREIHEPNNTRASWMRWASSFTLTCTFALAFFQQIQMSTVQYEVIVPLVALAITGKVAQKHLETKESKESKNEPHES